MATSAAATRTIASFLPRISLGVGETGDFWTESSSVSLIRAPQLQQNMLSSGFSAPHFMQYTTGLPSGPLSRVRRHLNYRAGRFRALAPSHAPSERVSPLSYYKASQFLLQWDRCAPHPIGWSLRLVCQKRAGLASHCSFLGLKSGAHGSMDSTASPVPVIHLKMVSSRLQQTTIDPTLALIARDVHSSNARRGRAAREGPSTLPGHRCPTTRRLQTPSLRTPTPLSRQGSTRT